MTLERGYTEQDELVLRLLLPAGTDATRLSTEGWDDLRAIATTNAVLLRAAGAFKRAGVETGHAFATGVAHERERTGDLLTAVRITSQICSDAGIPYVFLKALQHYPDMGQDLDLLVLANPSQFAPRLAAVLPVAVRPRGLSDRIAATVSYNLPGCRAHLDVQHRRLGLVGEHPGYAAQLIRRRIARGADGADVFVPTPEDQLILQGIQRVFGRRSLRLADVIWTMRVLRRGLLDWDYVIATVRSIAIGSGLGCFLSYVEQVHRRVLSGALLPAEVRRQLPLDGWGAVEFRDGRFRFAAMRVNARLSLMAFEAQLARRDWAAAARLSLVPLVAVAGTIDYLRQRAAQ